MTRSLQVVLAAALVAIGVAIGYSLHGGAPQSAAGRRTGSAATSQRVWTCSMHPQVRLDRPGKCPICAMPLIQAGGEQRATGGAPLLQLSEHAVAMASVDTCRRLPESA
ncbi:MAG TPA: heavy metal-binding domain-containing protein, partial [Thauera aminoaromatica]|nr:heavy metal-binding domain-containing protein [Thauera aminoaromatica]